MRIDAATVRDHARGCWVSLILPALGIDVPANPKRHGPCPVCGGRDRFRLDDQHGRGTWFCNQCDPQAGDGFALIQAVRNCNFKEALHLVAGILGLDATTSSRSRPTPQPLRINRVALAFQFELGALDHRLRAERIHEAAKGINLSTLSDGELDRVLSHVAQAYAEQNRADLFEGIADTLRARDITERISRERQARAA